jgi:tripartite-type tricarboxylate transporter receptor subunit TctC
MTRRRTLLGALAALPLARAALAQDRRAIRMVVAYAAGGGTDLMARAVAQKLGEILGQNIVIENRAGGNGTIGSLAVAQARPDGGTLLFATGSELSLKPLLEAGLPYDPDRDFEPVALCGITPVVIAVHPSLPARTLAEFIALAKARPGAINIANSGNGGIMHMTGAFLALRAGIDVAHVAYRGAAPAVADTAAGVTEAVVSGLPPVLAQAREGRLRILAVSIPRRSSAIPDVPTLEESGFPGFDMSNTVGIVTPRGTPPALVAQLNEAAVRAVQDAEVRRIFLANGAEPAGSTIAEYAAFIRAERERFREVVRLTGVRME